jgi:soluble lytic murein transglycosylase-like protein
MCLLAVSVALAQQSAAPQPVSPAKVEPAKVLPANTAPASAAPASAAPTETAPKAEAAAPAAAPSEAMRLSIAKQRAAIEVQRTAILKQAESAGARLIPGSPMPPMAFDAPVLQADCDPLADAVMAPLIEDNAKVHEVKPELLRAVIERESGFRPCAVSSKGAQGLMQLMPETSQELGVKDPFDPKQNVSAGAKFLKELMDKYQGDLSKALGAYNAGASAVDQAGGVPEIQETKDYVDAILKKLGIKPPVPPSIQMPKPIEN